MAGLRVLLVDGYDDTAETTARLLEWWGHKTHIAKDGLAALDKAIALEPQVVIAELRLPSLSGLDLARRLREQKTTACLIALTGLSDAKHRDVAHEAGFDYYLVKPAPARELLRVMSDCSLRHQI